MNAQVPIYFPIPVCYNSKSVTFWFKEVPIYFPIPVCYNSKRHRFEAVCVPIYFPIPVCYNQPPYKPRHGAVCRLFYAQKIIKGSPNMAICFDFFLKSWPIPSVQWRFVMSDRNRPVTQNHPFYITCTRFNIFLFNIFLFSLPNNLLIKRQIPLIRIC